jgi:ABC-type multidrug transport system ATPase subunit
VVIINKGKVMANDLTGNIGNYTITPSHTVIVEFREDPGGAFFESLDQVELTRKLSQNTWLLQTAGDSDIREELFRLAVKKGQVILSLHRKDRKLEDVFRELTS